MITHLNSLRIAVTLGFVVAIGLVVAILLLSERRSDAEKVASNPIEHVVEFDSVSLTRLDRVREQYAAIKSVQFEADVEIRLIDGQSMTVGEGDISYSAKDNKYKYVTSVTQNLSDAGLNRDAEVLFDGTKYYFYDKESRIVSYQLSEEVRIPNSIPNPFFLPLDFLSNDDDSCENCKMRLQDVKQPIRWPKRGSTTTQLSSENANGIIHSLVEMSGGTFNDVPYKFRVRMIGPESAMQIMSVSRVNANGMPLIEVISGDFRPIANFPLSVPHRIEVAARDDVGNLKLTAIYTLRNLKIDDSQTSSLFTPTFAGAEKFWDSDAKNFVQRLN